MKRLILFLLCISNLHTLHAKDFQSKQQKIKNKLLARIIAAEQLPANEDNAANMKRFFEHRENRGDFGNETTSNSAEKQ